MPNEDAPSGVWHCPACGEKLEATFDSCWKCGTQRDGSMADDFEPAVEPIRHCCACGYPLKGLGREQCPECGAFFSWEEVDTRDAGPAPSPAAGKSAWGWLIATAVSWVLALSSLLLVELIEDDGSTAYAVLESVSVFSVFASIASPIAFMLALFTHRR